MGDYDRRWRNVRARVLAGAQACAICGGMLDFDAPARSRLAPSVDHIFPLRAMRGLDSDLRDELRLDMSTLRPVHYSCNARRGAGRKDNRKSISREW
jgi:hypothetical protein